MEAPIVGSIVRAVFAVSRLLLFPLSTFFFRHLFFMLGSIGYLILACMAKWAPDLEDEYWFIDKLATGTFVIDAIFYLLEWLRQKLIAGDGPSQTFMFGFSQHWRCVVLVCCGIEPSVSLSRACIVSTSLTLCNGIVFLTGGLTGVAGATGCSSLAVLFILSTAMCAISSTTRTSWTCVPRSTLPLPWCF